MTRRSSRTVHWLLERIARRPHAPGQVFPGVATALDGQTAVAVAEATWCDTAALCHQGTSSNFADTWTELVRSGHRNAFGGRVDLLDLSGCSDALAGSIGAAATGLRTTGFLTGQDAVSTYAQCAYAAGQRIPMVLHLAAGSITSRSGNAGGGHAGIWSIADSGWGVLVATSVQEAVDLALVARIAAERSMTPVAVAFDAVETGLGFQDTRVPDFQLVRNLLSVPHQRIQPPTPSQRVLFGEFRSSVPKHFDLDHPGLLCPLETARMASPGAAAARYYFDDHVAPILASAMSGVESATGRAIRSIDAHHALDAELLLVTMGSMFESACRVADVLRQSERLRIGVLGIRQLRPWPQKALSELLGERSRVVVLERTDSPLAGDGPLTREVRGCLGRASRSNPVCQAIYGIGGALPSLGSIATMCRQLIQEHKDHVYLGVCSSPDGDTPPRRQAMLDRVHRDYPDVCDLCIDRGDNVPIASGSAGITVGVVHGLDDPDLHFSGLVARLMHGMQGEEVRCHFDFAPVDDCECHIDRIVSGHDCCTPDETSRVDIVLAAGQNLQMWNGPADLLNDGGVIILAREEAEQSDLTLPANLIRQTKARDLEIILATVDSGKVYEQAQAGWRCQEALLGALAAVLCRRLSDEPNCTDRVIAVREAMLEQERCDDRKQRIECFRKGLASWSRHSINDFRSEPFTRCHTTPGLLSRTKPGKHPLADLSGYWACRGHVGQSEKQTVDPFAALPSVPALSAALASVSSVDTQLPEFDPATCDGSGAIWTSCPDASIVAKALSARSLLEAGMTIARDEGHDAEAIRPILGKLASRINKEALAAVRPPTNVCQACETPFEWVLEKMAPTSERRTAMVTAFRAVIEAVGMLPIARTMPFFDEPEQEAPGTGAFLIVGIDPDACKSARAAVGPSLGRGLRLVRRSPSQIERARKLWRIYEQLPDTPGTIIDRARSHPAVGSLAAAMLAQSCAHAMAPRDSAEPGSGARLAMRQMLAACEASIQPETQRLLQLINDLRSRLGEKIQALLAAGIPEANLDALADGIQALGREDLQLADLQSQIAGAVERRTIDGLVLERHIEPARALADLEWRLREGDRGLGRARFGIVLGRGQATDWAAVAPRNPFSGPVMLSSNQFTPALAQGLCIGQMRHVLEAIRVVRWAQAVLDDPHGSSIGYQQTTELTWDDLAPNERACCAPLLVLADQNALSAADHGAIMEAIRAVLPIKFVLLTGGWPRSLHVSDLKSPGCGRPGTGASVAAMAMFQRSAYVASCSISNGNHLFETVQRALAFSGPALIEILAPSPRQCRFDPASTLDIAALAIQCRAHCLFRFDPDREGVFGSCLDLDGNPSEGSTLATDAQGRPLTPADWIVALPRFEDLFPLAGSRTGLVPIDEYVLMESGRRADQTPIVRHALDGTQRVVSRPVVKYADARIRLWRMLQELSGIVTPFTRRVQAEAEQSLEGEHQAELAKVRREHEQEIAAIRSKFEAEAVERVRNGLMHLAGYRSSSEMGRVE